MSIVVTKRSPEVVGSSEPGTPSGDIHLSLFDKSGGSVAVPLLLVFHKPIVDPVGTIRSALSRALVHYHPVSGRLAAGADGCDVITCTGEGVLFVGASASCAVDEVLSSPPPPALLNDLLVHYPAEYVCRPADPFVLMQVTEFSCGGFVVGVTWNHIVADGAGMAQFLQAVGELARGIPLPSVAPVRSDESVLAARAVGAVDFSSPEFTQGMAFLDLTVPSGLISRVKALCTCTAFEAVVALLWRCRARAVASSDKPVSLTFGSNVRGHVGAAEGYYGNCLLLESVAATSAEVAKGDIKDVVRLIKSAKRKVQEKMSQGEAQVAEPAARHRVDYSTLLVTSWRNIGLEAPDFGGGGAARVMWYMPQLGMPLCFICPPCKGKDGLNVLGYVVKNEHADAFMHEMAAPLLGLSPPHPPETVTPGPQEGMDDAVSPHLLLAAGE